MPEVGTKTVEYTFTIQKMNNTNHTQEVHSDQCDQTDTEIRRCGIGWKYL